jgi:hypothetical protein
MISTHQRRISSYTWSDTEEDENGIVVMEEVEVQDDGIEVVFHVVVNK